MTVTGGSGNIIAGVIETWRRFGVFDFILPFLLVFAIVYGVIERVKIFGPETGKRVNAIIAFTIAMITTLTGWFVSFLTGFMPWVSVISIVVVTVLMLVAMLAKEGSFEKLLENKEILKYGGVAILIAVGVVLLGLGFPTVMKFNINNILNAIGLTATDLAGIVFFVAFIVVIFLIGKGPKTEKPKTPPT